MPGNSEKFQKFLHRRSLHAADLRMRRGFRPEVIVAAMLQDRAADAPENKPGTRRRQYFPGNGRNLFPLPRGQADSARIK